METGTLNIRILGDHALLVNGLRHKLEQRFGSMVRVDAYCDSHHCLKSLDALTHILVLDESVNPRHVPLLARQFRSQQPGIDVLGPVRENDLEEEIAQTIRVRQLTGHLAALAF